METPPLTETEWIEACYQLLCQSQGAPQNATHENNLREYAKSIYDYNADVAKDDGEPIMSPQDAHDEELACGA